MIIDLHITWNMIDDLHSSQSELPTDWAGRMDWVVMGGVVCKDSWSRRNEPRPQDQSESAKYHASFAGTRHGQ